MQNWPETHTANEGPVRIHFKCLVPIYVFPEWNCAASLFPKQNYNVRSPSSYILHSYICERFIYFLDRSVYFAAAKYVDQSWEDINRSQTHECANWDWGRAIPRIGIHKWDFCCSALYSICSNTFTLPVCSWEARPAMVVMEGEGSGQQAASAAGQRIPSWWVIPRTRRSLYLVWGIFYVTVSVLLLTVNSLIYGENHSSL